MRVAISLLIVLNMPVVAIGEAGDDLAPIIKSIDALLAKTEADAKLVQALSRNGKPQDVPKQLFRETFTSSVTFLEAVVTNTTLGSLAGLDNKDLGSNVQGECKAELLGILQTLKSPPSVFSLNVLEDENGKIDLSHLRAQVGRFRAIVSALRTRNRNEK